MLTHLLPKGANPSRVVVNGAAGFIGGAIADRLEDDGITVLRLTRKDVDLLKEGAAEKLAKLLLPDDVFVAAAAIAPCKTSAMLKDNIIMANALVAALSNADISHLVAIGSDAVYADSAAPLTESSPMAPDNLHGVMHLAREVMFRQEIKRPLTVLRPTLVYGAGDPHNGYGPNKFRRLANKKEPIVLFGKGEEQRDHVSVFDIAELVCRVIKQKSVGALNVASGTVTSFRAIADAAVTLSGQSVAIEETQRKGPLPHNGFRAFSPAATYAAFPDFSYTPLHEGLANAQEEEFHSAAHPSSRLAS